MLLLFLVNTYGLFVWKTKKVLQLITLFKKFLDKSRRKPSKIRTDKRSIKLWLEDNHIEIYSTHNKEKFMVAERFIRRLKGKIYKYITHGKCGYW